MTTASGTPIRADTTDGGIAAPMAPLLGGPLRGPGLQIAVLGPDGSGKSTLLDGLETRLAPRFRAVYRMHFRPRLGQAGQHRPPTEDPHGTPPRSAPTSLAKLAFYALDHVIGYLLQTRPRRAAGSLVLYDRHFADLAIDPARYRYGGPVGVVGLAARLVPRPDITLILDAPAEIIRQRKQEVSTEETKRQIAAYRRLASRITNAYLIDAAAGPADVLAQAMAVVAGHLEADPGTGEGS